MDRHAVKEIMQEHKGRNYTFPIGVLAENVETDDEHQFVSKQEKEKVASPENVTVKFNDKGNDRTKLKSGTALAKLFAQTASWIAEIEKLGTVIKNLGTAAECDATTLLDVTQSGYVADARALKTVNDKFGGISLEQEGGEIYATYKAGADTVRKKLGDREFRVYKSVDISHIRDRNSAGRITVDCTDLDGYARYTAEDFLVVPAGVYERNVGYELVAMLDKKISWSYAGGVLTIENAVHYSFNSDHDSQYIEMWYSCFDIYAG